MKYWIFTANSGQEGAILSMLPRGGPKDYRYSKGQVLQEEYKTIDNPAMVFDSEYPDNTLLLDVLDCISSIPIVSKKVRTIFKEIASDKVEFLPVTLKDHRREVVTENYFILNPIGGIDIIDMDKSDYIMGSIIKTQINRIEKLVLNTDTVPKDAHIFRASKNLKLFFISDEARKVLEENKVTGYELFEAEGWDGLEV